MRDATGAQIKIEVTPVLRGSVYPPETRRVTPRVEEAYGFAEMQVVSFGDLYGGKLVAALDRQHPRDLFDVRELLRNEGIDGALRAAFATYLISHDRPMAEILVGKAKPLAQEFERGFAGMAEESVTLEDLQAAYVALIDRAVRQMPLKHRALLLSVERGEPDWALLGLNGVEDLPAVKWRLFNIRGLTPGRRAANVEALAAALGTDR